MPHGAVAESRARVDTDVLPGVILSLGPLLSTSVVQGRGPPKGPLVHASKAGDWERSPVRVWSRIRFAYLSFSTWIVCRHLPSGVEVMPTNIPFLKAL